MGRSAFVVQGSSPGLKYQSRAAGREIHEVSIAGGAPHSRQIGPAIWRPRQPRLLRTGNAAHEQRDRDAAADPPRENLAHDV